MSTIEHLIPEISINVYAVCEEENSIFPFRLSSKSEQEGQIKIDLLLLYDTITESYHYCLIRNLLRLVSSLNSNHTGAYYHFICRRCLLLFTIESRYLDHLEFCQTNQGQVLKLPTVGNDIQKFKNLVNVIPIPFLVFFDFECYTPVVSEEEKCTEITTQEKKYSWMKWTNEISHVATCTRCSEQSPCAIIRPSKNYENMISYSWGMQLSCLRKDLHDYRLILKSSSNERELLRQFLINCRMQCIKVYGILSENVPLEMSLEDQQKADSTLSCCYCQAVFDDVLCPGVLDHDHLDGSFR